MLKSEEATLQGAFLAALFAQEIGLPVGNMWEPPIARAIAISIGQVGAEQAEANWRFRLGLSKPSIAQ